MPAHARHRAHGVHPRVHAVHAMIRDMLKIGADGAAQPFLGEDSDARVGQPVEIEVLALRPLDLVALAVQPPDSPAGGFSACPTIP